MRVPVKLETKVTVAAGFNTLCQQRQRTDKSGARCILKTVKKTTFAKFTNISDRLLAALVLLYL